MKDTAVIVEIQKGRITYFKLGLVAFTLEEYSPHQFKMVCQLCRRLHFVYDKGSFKQALSETITEHKLALNLSEIIEALCDEICVVADLAASFAFLFCNPFLTSDVSLN